MTTRLDSARRSTTGGIPYVLMEGYPTGSVDAIGPAKTQERYLIRASDLESFLSESLPIPYVAGTYIVWPLRRRMPGTDTLVTQSISFAPHTGTKPADPFLADTDANAGTYDDLYVVTVDYSTSQESATSSNPTGERDRTKPETYLEHNIQSGLMLAELPPKGIYLVDKSIGSNTITADDHLEKFTTLDNVPAKRIPTITHTLHWPFAISPNWTLIRAMLGWVNSTVMPVFNNAPVETVLFESFSGRQLWNWNGRRLSYQPWALTFQFTEICIYENSTRYGWNHKWIGEHSRWMKVFREVFSNASDQSDSSRSESTNAGEYIPLYQLANFLTMFVAST